MKIMVVDDSKVMRSIIVRAIKGAGLESSTFVEASNGVEALAALSAESPDIVFADWNMPEMNGIDLLKQVRAQGSTVKFGFVTSESSPGIKDEAMAHGAAFLVSKPFTPEAIKTALATVL